MKQNKVGFSKKQIGIIGGILLTLMIIGSFFDLQISQALFNKENFIAKVFASFGEIPVAIALAISGTLLIKVYWDNVAIKKILAIVGGVLLNFMGVVMSCIQSPQYFPELPLPLSIAVMFVIIMLVNYTILKLTKNCDKADIKKVLKVIFFVALGAIIIINIVKIPWGRPRMRMIEETPEAYFQPWWVIGSSLKEKLMALGVASEEFKSFPSGHTGNAACAMLLILLPQLNHKLKGKENILLGIGVAYGLFVGFTRIIMGAHFLTDTVVGFTVTFIVLICMMKYIYRKD